MLLSFSTQCARGGDASPPLAFEIERLGRLVELATEILVFAEQP